MGFDSNPAHTFFPYPPFILILSAPFYLLLKPIAGWYDQRLVYLLVLAALAIACLKFSRRQKDLKSKTAPFLGFVVLNPFLVRYLLAGRNDIVCLLFLFLMVMALVRSRWVSACILLALACGVKQVAWFMIPFFFALAASPTAGSSWQTRKALLVRTGIAFAAVSLVIWLPFLIWNGRGLLYDVLVAQGSAYPFRPHGFGVTDLLMFFGVVDSYRDDTSMLLPGLLAALALLVWGCLRVYRCGRLSAGLLWFGLCLLSFLFFSRFFAPNHFVIPFIMLLLAAIGIEREERAIDDS
jgi:hypothetical protein